jgi:processive 1,2-diacylglycerol beta-glucosyltransferase
LLEFSNFSNKNVRGDCLLNKKKVVVFSAAFGAGHIRAAEAIIEGISRQEPELEIIHMDCGLFINAYLYDLLKVTYISLIKYAPKVWGKFYYDSSDILPDSKFQSFINNFGRDKTLAYIKSINPSLVICTYPTVSGAIAQLKMEGFTGVPLATVITDYAVHSQWVHANVDLYIVGSEDVRKDLIDRGIDAESVFVTGIPVNINFEAKQNRHEISAKLGLASDVPTVLIMSGAFGVLKDIKEICEFFANMDTPVQSIVVCGKDKSLYQSIGEIVNQAKNPMVHYGYVNNVEDLMSAADIMITKAGGLTVSEALSKHLPLIIYKPIPGQEEKNAMFLLKNKCAKVANSPQEIQEITHAILNNPQELKQMQEAAAQTVPGQATERAVTKMLQILV